MKIAMLIWLAGKKQTHHYQKNNCTKFDSLFLTTIIKIISKLRNLSHQPCYIFALKFVSFYKWRKRVKYGMYSKLILSLLKNKKYTRILLSLRLGIVTRIAGKLYTVFRPLMERFLETDVNYLFLWGSKSTEFYFVGPNLSYRSGLSVHVI